MSIEISSASWRRKLYFQHQCSDAKQNMLLQAGITCFERFRPKRTGYHEPLTQEKTRWQIEFVQQKYALFPKNSVISFFKDHMLLQFVYQVAHSGRILSKAHV
jgi:hypothetical protein